MKGHQHQPSFTIVVSICHRWKGSTVEGSDQGQPSVQGFFLFCFSRPCLSTIFIKRKEATDTVLMQPSRTWPTQEHKRTNTKKKYTQTRKHNDNTNNSKATRRKQRALPTPQARTQQLNDWWFSYSHLLHLAARPSCLSTTTLISCGDSSWGKVQLFVPHDHF